MCGLIGIITKSRNGFNQDQKAAFELLMFLDTLRGDDSSGSFLAHNNGNVDIIKSLDDGTQFIKKSEFKSQLQAAWSTGWAMIGHNRKSTRGATTEENAHPFWVDDKVVLVHNGTLFDHKKLADKEVDSHALAVHLSEKHTFEEIEEALQQVNGAYALMWYDVHNKRLNIIRNEDRPLCFMETPEAYYIASEAWMLHVIAMKVGLKGASKPELLDHSTLFQVQLNEDKSTTISHKVLDCKYRRVGTQFFQGQGTQYDADYWENHPFQRAAHGQDCAYGDCEVDEYEEAQKRLNAVARDSGGCGGESRQVADAILKAAEEIEKASSQTEEERVKDEQTRTFPNSPSSGFRHATVGRVLDGLDNKYTEVVFKDHPSLSNSYLRGTRVRCAIVGLIEADDKPKTDNFFLIGQQLNKKDGAYIVFPFKTKDFDSLIRMDERSIFDVEVDGVTWTRLNTHGSCTMNDWGGMTLVHCKDPRPVVLPPEEQYVH